jgi:Asp-tRNA(Asn)/Glu-tRNA(Gln) amidotransferase B subunit
MVKDTNKLNKAFTDFLKKNPKAMEDFMKGSGKAI